MTDSARFRISAGAKHSLPTVKTKKAPPSAEALVFEIS